jgi:hypothetical protein
MCSSALLRRYEHRHTGDCNDLSEGGSTGTERVAERFCRARPNPIMPPAQVA